MSPTRPAVDVAVADRTAHGLLRRRGAASSTLEVGTAPRRLESARRWLRRRPADGRERVGRLIVAAGAAARSRPRCETASSSAGDELERPASATFSRSRSLGDEVGALRPGAHSAAPPPGSTLLPAASKKSCESVGSSSPKSSTRPAARAASSADERIAVPAAARAGVVGLVADDGDARGTPPASRGRGDRRAAAAARCPDDGRAAPATGPCEHDLPTVDHDDLLAEVLDEVELVAWRRARSAPRARGARSALRELRDGRRGRGPLNGSSRPSHARGRGRARSPAGAAAASRRRASRCGRPIGRRARARRAHVGARSGRLAGGRGRAAGRSGRPARRPRIAGVQPSLLRHVHPSRADRQRPHLAPARTAISPRSGHRAPRAAPGAAWSCPPRSGRAGRSARPARRRT